MDINFSSNRFLSLLSRLPRVTSALSWRLILTALGSGFLLSTAASVVLKKVMTPQIETLPAKEHSLQPIPGNHLSLNKDDLETILARNIFNKDGQLGDEDGQGDANSPATSEIIKSTLPIKLIGTIFGGDPNSGMAIIEETEKRAVNSFFVGDTVYRDAKVAEIYRERIILDRGDRKEFLELETKERVDRKKQKIALAAAAAKPASAAATPDHYAEEGFERSGTTIKMSSDFRKKILTTDFAKVLQDAKAEPHIVKGELNGFRLTKIRPDSVYLKAGLQDGDVIKEINGVSLVDTAQAIKLLNSLRGENELDIRLERDGQSMSIQMEVK